MNERPILFNAAMVRAILSGRKTQTRRPVRGVPFGTNLIEWNTADRAWVPWNWTSGVGSYAGGSRTGAPFRCPLGQPGDRLWVRETFVSGIGLAEIGDAKTFHETCCAPAGAPLAPRWMYRADGHRIPGTVHWRPSIHMPRWASRITLEITDVRVQRVQEITEGDAAAEGIEACQADHAHEPHFCSFAHLWSAIYGAESWAQNAWVWAVTFRRVEP